LGSTAHVAHALGHRGFLALRRGDIAGAARAFSAAERACDPSDVIVLPDVQHGLAQCALASGDLDRADDLCSAAIAGFRGARKRQQLAPILLTRAAARARKGETAEAAGLAREALAAAGEGTDTVLCAAASLEAAALLVALTPSDPDPDYDRDAADATRGALALIHQRDYRFLMRTKADALETLYPHFGRWGLTGALPAERRPARSPYFEVELLGGVRVTVEGRRIPPEAWKRRRAREIFAYLVGQAGRPVSRSRLIDLYWPEADADAAHDSLRVTISAIRKAVGDVVRYETNGYRFAAPPGTVVDVAVFDENVEQARAATVRGDLEAARRHYRLAAETYRGEFLEGIDEGGWQWHERERLRAASLETLRWIAVDATDDAAGRLALERLLTIAPFDLEAVRMRLDLLVRERRVAEARRDYAEWRARYLATVGTDPPEVWGTVPLAV
jgi:DNA-binding SARP family transcriptional activator